MQRQGLDRWRMRSIWLLLVWLNIQIFFRNYTFYWSQWYLKWPENVLQNVYKSNSRAQVLDTDLTECNFWLLLYSTFSPKCQLGPIFLQSIGVAIGSSTFCTKTITNPLTIQVNILCLLSLKISQANPYQTSFILSTISLKFYSPFFWKISVNSWNFSRKDSFLDRCFFGLLLSVLLNTGSRDYRSSFIFLGFTQLQFADNNTYGLCFTFISILHCCNICSIRIVSACPRCMNSGVSEFNPRSTVNKNKQITNFDIIFVYMLDQQSSNLAQKQVSELIQSSIEKISTQIANSAIQTNNHYEPHERNQDVSQDDAKSQSQRNQFESKNDDQMEIQSTHSRFMDNKRSKADINHPKSKLAMKQQDKKLQKELSEKARHFIAKIRNKKKEVEGEFVIKKIAEEHKKKQEQRKKQVEDKVQKQIQKQIRKLQAEKNIQYFREKHKLYSRNSSSFFPPKNRAQSKAIPRYSRNSVLPSIKSRNLEEIMQQPTRRKSPTDRTVLKVKRRSQTVSDVRDDQSQNSQSTQIKLFDYGKSNKSRSSSFRQNLNLHSNQRRYDDDDDKKCYLMSRNNTEDISVYLSKFSNFGEIRNSYSKFSERNKNERAVRKKFPISSLHLNQIQNQIEEEDI